MGFAASGDDHMVCLMPIIVQDIAVEPAFANSMEREPGSLEIVQCLLLMSRYLQCTNNPHQTWMAIGSAVRIAQSLGLHLSGSASSSHSNRDTRLRRQLWQCCVFMDRCACLSFLQTYRY
jgi:hypothetical protein